MKTILNIENISKSFQIRNQESINILKNLSFSVIENEFMSIVGPSGIGKSTLLYIIGTLDKPDNGEIIFYNGANELKLNKMPENELHKFRNKNIGFVFQFHHLLPEFTALENIMMPALIAGRTKKDAQAEAKNLIDKVGVSHRSTHKPNELSGGEQQRIAVARALINTPSLIIADEPTGNLDQKNSASILELIQQLKQEFKLTVICATHSPDVASISDRIMKLSEKGIEQTENIHS